MVRTRFALILYFRMVAHKAACHTLSKVIPLGQSKDFTGFGDLALILKVIHQHTKVDFIAKHEIFLEQIDGYSSDLSGYIILTGLGMLQF